MSSKIEGILPDNEKNEEKQTGEQLVIAKYKFEGRNNDEVFLRKSGKGPNPANKFYLKTLLLQLSFAKNDVITVNQQLEGGWWEGSLDGRVGWFPADFVGIVKKPTTEGRKRRDLEMNGTNGGGGAPMDQTKLEETRAAYRAQLVQDFLKKEKENLAIIEKAFDGLKKLAKESNELPTEATAKLTEFINFKGTLLKRIEEQSRYTLNEQKIGKLFLDIAPTMRSNLLEYCEKHSDFVEFINQKTGQIEKKQLMNDQIDTKAMVLGLSLVFRHIQKYASILHEIERNTPETHPDRGNLQRAAQVYLDFHEECELARRQREAQLDVVQSGILQEKFGANFEQKLGKLLYTGKVGVSEVPKGKAAKEANDDDNDDQMPELDRCIAIFSSTILLLQMQPSGQYALKNQFRTADLIVKQIDRKNAVQMRKGEDALMVRSVGKKDYQHFVEILRTIVGPNKMIKEGGGGNTMSPMRRKKHPENYQTDGYQLPISSPYKTPTNGQTPQSVGKLRIDHQLEMIQPEGLLPSSTIAATDFTNGAIPSSSRHSKQPYSGWALRPIPPHKAEWLPGAENSASQQIKLRKGLSAEEQEDARLLKIVEGYCIGGPGGGHSSANIQCCAHGQKQRNSADSCHSPYGGGPVRRAASYPDHHETTMGRPQLIVAEDEKLFVEEMEGDKIVVKERSLVDTVYALKDQLIALTKEVGTISKGLEHEQRARRRMEEYIRSTQSNHASTLNNSNANFNSSMTNQSSATTMPLPTPTPL